MFILTLTIEHAENPVYTDAEGNGIDLLVKFAELDAPIQFHAVAHDDEPHGQQLYDNAKTGLYGPIGVFVEGEARGN